MNTAEDLRVNAVRLGAEQVRRAVGARRDGERERGALMKIANDVPKT